MKKERNVLIKKNLSPRIYSFYLHYVQHMVLQKQYGTINTLKNHTLTRFLCVSINSAFYLHLLVGTKKEKSILVQKYKVSSNTIWRKNLVIYKNSPGR